MSKFFTGINNIDYDYPIGTILIYSGVMTNAKTIPGWLCCDGGGYKSSIYLELYNVIGIKYGNGDGGANTDFNVLDFRGVIPIGNGLFNDVSGNITGGGNTTISSNQMPYHNHNITGGIKSAGDHTHVMYLVGGSQFYGHRQTVDYGYDTWWPNSDGAKDGRFNIWSAANSGSTTSSETTTVESADHSHGGSMTIGNSTSSSTEVSITPINYSMFYIIKY